MICRTREGILTRTWRWNRQESRNAAMRCPTWQCAMHNAGWWLLHFQQKLARDKSFYGSAQKSGMWMRRGRGPQDATEGHDVLNVMTTGGTRRAGDCRLSSSAQSASGRHLGSHSQSHSHSYSPTLDQPSDIGHQAQQATAAGQESNQSVAPRTKSNWECSYLGLTWFGFKPKLYTK